MADYASIADDFADKAVPSKPAKATPYSSLADEFGDAVTPKKQSKPNEKAFSGPAKFEANDPASMRRQIEASGNTKLLAAFDQQYPGVVSRQDSIGGGRGVTPASAYWQAGNQAQSVSAQKRPDAGLIGHLVTGLGSTIAGGYNGMYQGLKTLIKTGDTDQAVNAAGDAVRSTQEKYTYSSPDPTEQAVQSGIESPYNPINYPAVAGNYLGGKIADVGLPGLGASVNAGVSVLAPTHLIFNKAGAPLKAIVKPEEVMSSPKIEPTLQPAATQKPLYRMVDGEWKQVDRQPAPIQNNPSPTLQEQPKPANQSRQPSNQMSQLSPEEQKRREDVLASVGIENARHSAISGDAKAAATDYQTSKLDNPAGNYMRGVLDQERNALTNYADKLVKDTGGTSGIDQSSVYARGNTITGALDAYKSWFDNKIGDLYRAADERAQGVPTKLDRFKEVLGDSSELTNSDRVHLQGAVNAYLKKLDLIGEDGSFIGNAKQAETVRKYLNEQWSPQNGKFVAKLKDALDDDVTGSAGEDIYAQARQVRLMRGNTLDNPNGIAKIMDASGPEGINRSVPIEKIPDALVAMPVDQLTHVVETLKNAPPELQPQAQAALNEMRAHFANKLQATGASHAGQWNAKGVRQFLENNKERMSQVFTPDEMKSFANLKEAGEILAKDQSYPGAAVQGHNLVRSGVMHGIQTGAAAVGGAIAGPTGAAAGSFLGGKAAQAIGDKASLKSAQSRVKKLSDLPDARR